MNNKVNNKVENLLDNIDGETEYFIQIQNLKQSLNYGLLLKKIHRFIRFNWNVCLKSYFDMNKDQRKNQKHDFEKDFFKSINNAEFGKAIKMWEKAE